MYLKNTIIIYTGGIKNGRFGNEWRKKVCYDCI